MIRLNKKAGEKIFSIWWFLCLVLVGVAVVIVVINHFGALIDTRDEEAMILQEKIMGCIVKNGYLHEEILKLTPEQFLDFCNLNKNQFSEDSFRLFNLIIYDESLNIKTSFLIGQVPYREDCLVVAGKKAEHYPFCIQSNESVVFFNPETSKRESWSIYLLVASNNLGYKEPILKKEVVN